MVSYSGDNLLLCFEVVDMPDAQGLSTIRYVVTNDMECLASWTNYHILILLCEAVLMVQGKE